MCNEVDSSSGLFPYDLAEPSDYEVINLRKRYNGYLSGAVTVGPEKYFLQGIYKDYAQAIYDFKFRSSDVVVASYPKTGTTWTQELVWHLVNGFDYERARTSIEKRFPMLESDCVIDRRVFEFPEVAERMKEELPPPPFFTLNFTRDLPDRRTIKTHMPFSLLSPDLITTAKVVYVTRDPRDVVVSFYHHHKIIASHGFKGTLEEFVDDFIDEKVMFSPFWSHLREAYERRESPNLLIIQYEELKADLPSVVLRIAKFLDVAVNKDQLGKLVQHLHIDSMKKNPAINPDDDAIVTPCPRDGGFVRKGVAGGWRGRLSEDMQAKVKKWMDEKAGGLDKHFGWTW
ncbi:Sulfotransferase domain [Trinorchestia longiramus]|nr:Sulfotransferase domain [Trinorchestia longiramus]